MTVEELRGNPPFSSQEGISNKWEGKKLNLDKDGKITNNPQPDATAVGLEGKANLEILQSAKVAEDIEKKPKDYLYTNFKNEVSFLPEKENFTMNSFFISLLTVLTWFQSGVYGDFFFLQTKKGRPLVQNQ